MEAFYVILVIFVLHNFVTRRMIDRNSLECGEEIELALKRALFSKCNFQSQTSIANLHHTKMLLKIKNFCNFWLEFTIGNTDCNDVNSNGLVLCIAILLQASWKWCEICMIEISVAW